MLASKVEDKLNTVVSNCLYEFEKKVHEERKNGEITPERIGDIWLKGQVESLGPALKFSSFTKITGCTYPFYSFPFLCLCICFWRLSR